MTHWGLGRVKIKVSLNKQISLSSFGGERSRGFSCIKEKKLEIESAHGRCIYYFLGKNDLQWQIVRKLLSKN